MTRFGIAYSLLLMISGLCSNAGAHTTDADTPAWGAWHSWGDLGNGRYQNPVIPADYSDIDCIRVGKDFFAISSTMQFSPGMIVLHSKDLVNWQIVGHAVNDGDRIGVYCYNNLRDEGYIDIDSFTYRVARQ